jgi:hypothetical protein
MQDQITIQKKGLNLKAIFLYIYYNVLINSYLIHKNR